MEGNRQHYCHYVAYGLYQARNKGGAASFLVETHNLRENSECLRRATLRCWGKADSSEENDYVRTIFISYPAQHHRSRDKHALGQILRRHGAREVQTRETGFRIGSVALRAEGRLG